MSDPRTSRFFDGLAPSYDQDVVAVGWDPIALLQEWPLIVPPGSMVLDVGCGTGAVLDWLAGADRQLVGMDWSSQMIQRCRRRGSLRESEFHVQSAASAWPIPDESVDVTVALAMLEFVPDLDFVFDELVRVLRPWGKALVTVEDVADWAGQPHPKHELRYGEFPLWRRSLEDIELTIPPGLDVARVERRAGYTVLEEGFTCAYWVLELRRNDWYPN
jgi:ubiquinone/menaquinone biosynthesis C-methylase UbiE